MSIAKLISGLNTDGQRGHFFKKFITVAGGTAIGQLIIIVVYPILTRLYMPKALGLYGTFLSLLTVLAFSATLRYEQAVVLAEDERDTMSVIQLCFMLLFVMMLLAFIVVELLAISAWHPKLWSEYLYTLPLGIFVVGGVQVLYYWLIKHREFTRLAKYNIGQKLCQALGQALLGFTVFIFAGLIMGYIFSQTVIFITLIVFRRNRQGQGRKFEWSRIYAVAKRYKKFPIYSCPANLVSNLSLHLPQVFIASLFGFKIAGLYFLAKQLMGAPISLISQSVMRIIFPENVDLKRGSPELLKHFNLSLFKKLVLIGLPIFILIDICSPTVIPIVFGIKWVNAADYIIVLSVMFFMQMIATPFGVCLDAFERQGLQLCRESIMLVLALIPFLFAYLFRFSAITTMIIYSISSSISYIIYLYITWVAINSYNTINTDSSK